MLTENQIDRALQAINADKQAFASSHKDLLEIVEQGLQALKFAPYGPDSFFQNEFAKGFEELIIFNLKMDRELLTNQLQFIFVFLYALYFERLLTSSTFDHFATLLMRSAANAAHLLQPEFCVRLELFRGRVIGNYREHQTSKLLTELKVEKETISQRLLPIGGKLDGWESALDGWQSRIDSLEKKIKGEYGKLNFVGLSDAFSGLIKKKHTERRFQILLMLVLGCFLLAAPIASFCFLKKLPMPLKLDSLIFAAPLTVAVLLLLYFFRIALRNFYSVKAQLLQLELRYHICAFIQGYSEFVAGANTSKNPAFLEKFDSLVFGGISADIQNIPTQFDGLDSLLAVVKELKAKS